MPWSGERLIEHARGLWAAGVAPRDVTVAKDVPSAVTLAECRRLGELARGKRVLELGSYFGRSTIALASTATLVHSVDLHPAEDINGGQRSTVAPFLENLERYDVRHKVIVHVGFSQLILPELPAASFDLAFLDAQHQREAVEEDVQLVLPLLRPGATLAFHDYGVPGVEHDGRWDPFGVTEVVDALAIERGGSLEIVGTLAVLT
jgi:predicted O-methyltransferase YrrM